MKALLTAAEMRAADTYTIEKMGVPSLELMERAAHQVAEAICRDFPQLNQTKGLVIAGTGNNGGDALAVVRLLQQKGAGRIDVWLKEGKLSPDAQVQRAKLPNVNWVQDFSEADWIVDGLFGTGFHGGMDRTLLSLIEKLNRRAKGKVYAIDIPSGLSADTGQPLPSAVRADTTITLGCYKRGLVTGEAANWVGELKLGPIGIPDDIPGIKPGAYLYSSEDARLQMPPRRPASHKGSYGHLYIWGGAEQTEGAAALACVAAFRSGVGLLSLISDRSLEGLRRRLPIEVMSQEVNRSFFSDTKEGALVMGPGLGKKDRWDWVQAALSSTLSVVLDADGLNLLAEQTPNEQRKLCERAAPLLLTPHPKEASRLLGCSVEEVQADRYASCQKLVDQTGAAVLLKGKGTVIGAPTKALLVVAKGDSSLSKAGTGDVLSGILGALLAQNVEVQQAAALGAYLHGRAAEILTKRLGTERSALASEIADTVPAVWSELEKK